MATKFVVGYKGNLCDLSLPEQHVVKQITGTYMLEDPRLEEGSVDVLLLGNNVYVHNHTSNKPIRKALLPPRHSDLEATIDLEHNKQHLALEARGQYRGMFQWRPYIDLTFPTGETYTLYAEHNGEEYRLTANGQTANFNKTLSAYLENKQNTHKKVLSYFKKPTTELPRAA